MKSISVVIPNFNGRELLGQNLPHLFYALFTSGVTDYEIIVADDASRDGSVDYLLKTFPEVLVISHPVNSGFAGNCNSGIFVSSKELVFLLNTDVELTEGFFIPLMKYFDRQDTFGVMSRIIGLDTDKIQDGAKFPDCSFGHIGSTLNYRSETQTTLYTLFLSGANALMDREKLLELGGFDELFNPYYAEDVDLGLRAWKLGYKCYYDDTAVCRHPVSATIKKEKPDKVLRVSKRNKMFLHYIHLGLIERIAYVLMLTLKTALRKIMRHEVYVQAYKDFVRMIPEADESRQRIRALQQSRRVAYSLREVSSLIKRSIGSTPITKF
jgi:GT2 family glycosyltransferase